MSSHQSSQQFGSLVRTQSSHTKCHTHVQPWRELLSFRKSVHCSKPWASFWKSRLARRRRCVTRGAFLGSASLILKETCHMAQDRDTVQHQSREPYRCCATRAALVSVLKIVEHTTESSKARRRTTKNTIQHERPYENSTS